MTSRCCSPRNKRPVNKPRPVNGGSRELSVMTAATSFGRFSLFSRRCCLSRGHCVLRRARKGEGAFNIRPRNLGHVIGPCVRDATRRCRERPKCQPRADEHRRGGGSFRWSNPITGTCSWPQGNHRTPGNVVNVNKKRMPRVVRRTVQRFLQAYTGRGSARLLLVLRS